MTTSIFRQMEDNLNIIVIGRQPKIWHMEDGLNYFLMEDDFKFVIQETKKQKKNLFSTFQLMSLIPTSLKLVSLKV